MNIGVETAPIEQIIAYLRTLPAIRERCSQVFTLAQQGRLEYFDYHPELEDAVIKFCSTIIQVRNHTCTSDVRPMTLN